MSQETDPISFGNLKQKNTPVKYAVGWPAIGSSVKHVFSHMPAGRGLKVLFNLNQKGKIDCPSCAWPDPEHRSALGEYCENGAKAIAEEATTRKTGPAFFQRYSIAELREKTDYWLGQQGRLTHALIKQPDDTHYRALDWPEAFHIIGEAFSTLSSPHEATFYTSGRSSNEAAYLYQLFVRAWGTNNLPDCSNMCHESSGVALTHTLGLGKGSVSLEDFYVSELIIIMGQNPGTNHPRMLGALEKAKENGATIVSINPLIEPGLVAFRNPQSPKGLLGSGTTLTDLYLQIKINADLALLKAILKIVIKKAETEPEILDQDFILSKTEHFNQLLADLELYHLDTLIADTGLEPSLVHDFAELIAQKKRIIICWAMGLTQHKNAVATIQELVNLLLIKGSIGKPGSGTCPVRGHSNVQGDRTVGIMHQPSEALNQALQKKYGFVPPHETGLDVVESLEAMDKGQVKIFMALGGNFLSAVPDTAFSAKALEKTDLCVHISTKLNRSHLFSGKTSVILPCLGRTDRDQQQGQEQYLSTENSMGSVQISKGVLEPLSEHMKSEPWIVAGLAQAVLVDKYGINWPELGSDYALIREHIAETIAGFKDYNQKLQAQSGFSLPNGPREGHFLTPSQKAQFTLNVYQKASSRPDQFTLMTIRSHDQFNTTVYGLDDRYRGIFGERRIVLINPLDLEKIGKNPYDIIDLQSQYNNKTRTVKQLKLLPYNIPQGCLAAYFPECNNLIPATEYAEKSQTPISKSVIVKIVENAENL
jgi:molybdopterin-dependent oxidoreductase alpha subunit